MRKRKCSSDRAGVRERLCRALDIPPNTLPSTADVLIRGRNSVYIENGGRILAYTPECIEVRLPKGSVRIDGKRLVCAAYRRGALRIDGHVLSVSFGEEK